MAAMHTTLFKPIEKGQVLWIGPYARFRSCVVTSHSSRQRLHCIETCGLAVGGWSPSCTDMALGEYDLFYFHIIMWCDLRICGIVLGPDLTSLEGGLVVKLVKVPRTNRSCVSLPGWKECLSTYWLDLEVCVYYTSHWMMHSKFASCFHCGSNKCLN